jgi:hypothetical protein
MSSYKCIAPLGALHLSLWIMDDEGSIAQVEWGGEKKTAVFAKLWM